MGFMATRWTTSGFSALSSRANLSAASNSRSGLFDQRPKSNSMTRTPNASISLAPVAVRDDGNVVGDLPEHGDERLEMRQHEPVLGDEDEGAPEAATGS